MSFDKMNQFVDEHTILMREFLRNISTLTADDEELLMSESNDFQVGLLNSNPNVVGIGVSTNRKNSLPIVNLTPQTPTTKRNSEVNFNLELIDLAKQLSILHMLLTSILNGLEDVRKLKLNFYLL
jgi:hypothetical protein